MTSPARRTLAMPREHSPFHAGEQTLQLRAGVRERMAQIGRKAIHDFMPDQHRALFAELPFVVVGALDGRRRPWASVLVGTPGFMSSPDPWTLRIAARAGFGDPIAAGLVAGAPVGLLGIQLETRRRNRMNGTVIEAKEEVYAAHTLLDVCAHLSGRRPIARHTQETDGTIHRDGVNRIVVRVDQSFGNCPQYIQARRPLFLPEPSPVVASRSVRVEGTLLSADAAALVRRADTFFMATASPAAGSSDPVEGVDVSHRGGKPGFVRVDEGDGRTVLTSPDFRGNSFFNTFGNLALNPRAGIVFVDFAAGGLLSLTGEAEVVWDGPELEAFAGAQRLLRFRVDAGVWTENAVPLRWSAPAPAPQLAATGSWEDFRVGPLQCIEPAT